MPFTGILWDMSIYEVARVAGVSKSTVSRVINRGAGVASTTQTAVEDAMRRLGYWPSDRRPGPKPRRVAQMVRRGVEPPRELRSGCIALVNAGRSAELLGHPYYARLQRVLRTMLAGKGLNLVLDDMSPERAPLCVSEGRVDGVILTGQSPDERFLGRLGGVPTVWMGGGPGGRLLVDHVLADNFAIGTMAAEYLLAAGCRRLAFMNPDPAANSSASREWAFCARVGSAPVERFVYHAEQPQAEDWISQALKRRLGELIDRMLASPALPDGLFLPYDQHAPIVQLLLAQRGVRSGPPGKESGIVLISVGNEEPFLGSMARRSATIDPNPQEMAAWAMDQLLARIDQPSKDPVRVMVQPYLVAPTAAEQR